MSKKKVARKRKPKISNYDRVWKKYPSLKLNLHTYNPWSAVRQPTAEEATKHGLIVSQHLCPACGKTAVWRPDHHITLANRIRTYANRIRMYGVLHIGKLEVSMFVDVLGICEKCAGMLAKTGTLEASHAHQKAA